MASAEGKIRRVIVMTVGGRELRTMGSAACATIGLAIGILMKGYGKWFDPIGLTGEDSRRGPSRIFHGVFARSHSPIVCILNIFLSQRKQSFF
jgi:hypothetical protein